MCKYEPNVNCFFYTEGICRHAIAQSEGYALNLQPGVACPNYKEDQPGFQVAIVDQKVDSAQICATI